MQRGSINFLLVGRMLCSTLPIVCKWGSSRVVLVVSWLSIVESKPCLRLTFHIRKVKMAHCKFSPVHYTKSDNSPQLYVVLKQ